MQRWQDVRGIIQKARDQGLSHEELAQAFSRARQLLEWAPAMPLERGLAETVGWARSHDAA